MLSLVKGVLALVYGMKLMLAVANFQLSFLVFIASVYQEHSLSTQAHCTHTFQRNAEMFCACAMSEILGTVYLHKSHVSLQSSYI